MNIHDNFIVSAIPLSISDGDKDKNLASLQQLMDGIEQGTDLVVLPEMFSTGFICDPLHAKKIAESNDGDTISSIARLASEHSCAIAGSFLAVDNGKLFNRGFIMEPQGEVTFYDKHHLFSLSDESSIMTPGIALPKAVRFRGLNIAMVICYDIRFPLWCRNCAGKYDLLVVPANWPAKRGFAWEHLLQARAIENQAFIVGANRAGEDRYGCYDGQTFIFDYTGKRIDSGDTPSRQASLSRNNLYRYREAFPFLSDADEFILRPS